jgi:hypothetical protein
MADTVQELLEDYPFEIDKNIEGGGMGFSTLLGLGAAGHLAPPYWSKARDKWLFSFARKVDVIKITVKTFISKANTIPVRIYPKDRSIVRHANMAVDMHEALMRNSGLFKGFRHEFQRFLFDYLNQDNGGFMLILGGGRVDGPIVGAASGLVHLESYLCNRTSNPEYPVVYYHEDGKRYKIHYTRLIDMVSLPAPETNLNGVGLCPTSLCIDSGQEVLDMYIHSQEKHGSRPARQILYARKGATIDQLSSAIQHGEMKLDSEGHTRFSKTLLVAPKLPGGELILELIDLASSPDGFDRQTVTLLDMAVIAASFGLDLRDLAHSFGISGQTRSDAEVQDRKGRGKGVGEFIESFSEQLTQKFLPEYLLLSFDNLDDNQDEQRAKIQGIRSTARGRDVTTGIMTVRASRHQMLRAGEIQEEDFDEMELTDGRLPDGNDILSLFYSTDFYYSAALKIPSLPDPIDYENNDPYFALDAIKPALIKAWGLFENETNPVKRKKARQVIAALEKLQEAYREVVMVQEAALAEQMQQDDFGAATDDSSGSSSSTKKTTKPTDKKAGVEKGSQTPFLVKAAGITPNGSNSVVTLPLHEKYSEAEIQAAIERFYEVNPNYRGLLDDPSKWQYDPETKRFKNLETGRFVGNNRIDGLADRYDDTWDSDVEELTENLVHYRQDMNDWLVDFLGLVAGSILAYYLLGVGGLSNMTEERWAEVSELVNDQINYMNGFASDVAAGGLSAAQIAARTAMYFASTQAAYSYGKASKYGLVLPAYPRDSSTPCRSYCRCSWRISEYDDRWECVWTLGYPITEHCPTCVSRSSTWNPYVVYK